MYLKKLRVSSHFQIKFKELTFLKLLCVGGIFQIDKLIIKGYGEVYHGKWLGQDVAIK